jgi:hypothetical protein
MYALFPHIRIPLCNLSYFLSLIFLAFIAGQPGGDKSYPGMKYSFFSTCPYMEQLYDNMKPTLRDGTYFWELPLSNYLPLSFLCSILIIYIIIENGHVPFIAVDDIGKYVRYQFDHFDDFVGKTLEASSDHVG